MRLPNADRAFIDEGKIEEYCLDMQHESGRHKAIVFKAVMNQSAGDSSVLAALLRDRILEG